MSGINYLKFRVTGGVVMEAINAVYADRQAVLAKIKTEVERFGADHAVGQRGVAGLVFSDSQRVPAGWMSKKCFDEEKREVKGYYFPSRRSKVGKELLAEWDKLRIPGAASFQAKVPGTSDLMFTSQGPHGMSFRYWNMHPEKVGEVWVLHVPDLPTNSREAQSLGEGKGPRWSPPDDGCVRLKESEYHALKEAQEAAAAESGKGGAK